MMPSVTMMIHQQLSQTTQTALRAIFLARCLMAQKFVLVDHV